MNNHVNFSIEWDPEVLTDKDAGILGIVAAAPAEDVLQSAINWVPNAFRQFIPIMTTEAAIELPNRGPSDPAIDLKEGETPAWGSMYALNEVELDQLYNRLKKMTDMGAVRELKSSCSKLVLFVPKGHGCGLNLCIDFRGINKIMVTNRYPLSNMDEIKDHFSRANWFTKMDLTNGYHLIWIKKGDEWNTAFLCQDGLLQYTVMPFGLVNASMKFQSMINHIFWDMQDKGMIAFMDKIIIHAEIHEKHDELILKVLKRLCNNCLCIAPDKCEWAKH